MRMMLPVLLAALVPNSYAAVVQLRLPGAEGQTLALHCIEPSKKGTDAVLFIHGASFPTMLAAGFEFYAKDSWMNFMANRGLLADWTFFALVPQVVLLPWRTILRARFPRIWHPTLRRRFR